VTLSRWGDFFREGLRNIYRHKTRSALTLLGVVFGIAAVITMMGIGEGAQRSVLAEISGLGLRNIIAESVRPTQQRESPGGSNSVRDRLDYGLTFRDARQIAAGLEEVGATINIAHQIKHKVYYRGALQTCKTLGVNPDYWSLVNAQMERGQPISALHELRAKKVAVVNLDFFNAMQSIGNGLGETLKIGAEYFEVIGVVDIPAHSGRGYVYVPYRTASAVFGTVFLKRESGDMEYSQTEVGQLIVQAPSEETVKTVSDVVAFTLKNNHEQDDYTLYVPLNILESKQRTQQILNLVLVTIAAISLIVGGIGIMNIMLASVTERIPEIGIRRAVGATQQDILYQFLAETTTLTLTGGVLGCVAGMIFIPVASTFTGWQGVVTASSVIVSLFVSILVGLIFGITPAINASRMDPGAALRYE
jgi:putative ABC transport system permease protein